MNTEIVREEQKLTFDVKPKKKSASDILSKHHPDFKKLQKVFKGKTTPPIKLNKKKSLRDQIKDNIDPTQLIKGINNNMATSPQVLKAILDISEASEQEKEKIVVVPLHWEGFIVKSFPHWQPPTSQ